MGKRDGGRAVEKAGTEDCAIHKKLLVECARLRKTRVLPKVPSTACVDAKPGILRILRTEGEMGMKLGWEIALRVAIYIVAIAISILLARWIWSWDIPDWLKILLIS